MFFGKKKKKKLLKVGLIQGNRPLVQKDIKPGKKVSIGPHDKNTFVIQSNEIKLPSKFTVFKPSGNRYLLFFLPGMDGKIAVSGNAVNFDTLKQRGIVESKKGQHCISISNRTRGKITFGNNRLLFRFEDAR